MEDDPVVIPVILTGVTNLRMQIGTKKKGNADPQFMKLNQGMKEGLFAERPDSLLAAS